MACFHYSLFLVELLFTGILDLRHLNLSGNRFRMLEETTLARLHKLESLIVHDVPLLSSLPTEATFRALRLVFSVKTLSKRRISGT